MSGGSLHATGSASVAGRRTIRALVAGLLALALAACAAQIPRTVEESAEAARAVRVVDRSVEDGILALDPTRVTPDDVKLLAKGPAPRIMLLHGGIYPVHLAMESFGEFLVGMGYPESRIRQPRDGAWSHSPYEDANRLAGIAAWYYEKDGMPPILIGHSQGGMQAVKVLHVLAGGYGDTVPVWSPLTDFPEDRSAIVDPLTGKPQPVVGLRLGYASAVGAGGAAFLLPNQWSLIGRLRNIPDNVEEFTGYWIDVDLWAWTLPGTDNVRDFTAGPNVRLRNVTLSAANNHVFLPASSAFAGQRAERAWIEAYYPGTREPPPAEAEVNIAWAADVWYDIKKYWVIEAQRLIRAKRANPQPAVAGKLE